MWFAITTSNDPLSNGSDCTSHARPCAATKPLARARAVASPTMPLDRSVNVSAIEVGSESFSQNRPMGPLPTVAPVTAPSA